MITSVISFLSIPILESGYLHKHECYCLFYGSTRHCYTVPHGVTLMEEQLAAHTPSLAHVRTRFLVICQKEFCGLKSHQQTKSLNQKLTGYKNLKSYGKPLFSIKIKKTF